MSPYFSAALDSYASDLVTEIREDPEFERAQLESFVPCVLGDDIYDLVTFDVLGQPRLYEYAVDYVSAKVIEAFRSN